MGRKCQIEGCVTKQGMKIPLLRVPRWQHEFDVWEKVCREQADSYIKPNSVICALHFEKIGDEYDRTSPPSKFPEIRQAEPRVLVQRVRAVSKLDPEPDITYAKCRVCLNELYDNEAGWATDFLDPYEDGFSLKYLIESIFHLQLNESRFYPVVACRKCVVNVQLAKEFKEKVLRSNDHFPPQIFDEEEDDTVSVISHKEDEDEMEEDHQELILEKPKDEDELEEDHQELILEEPEIEAPEHKHNIEDIIEEVLETDDPSPVPEESDGHNEGNVEEETTENVLIEEILEEDETEETEGTPDLPWTSKNIPHFIPDPSLDSRDPHPCPQCGKVLKRRDAFIKHLATHAPVEERPFKCPKCDKRFSSQGVLRTHYQRKHDPKKRYICQDCGLAFTSYGTMWNHLQTHNKERSGFKVRSFVRRVSTKESQGASDYIQKGLRIPCEFCNKITVNIKKHVEDVHKTEYVPSEFHMEKVQCQECGKEVPRHRMYSHINLNHNAKQYVCNICGEIFKRFTAFQVHMDRHLNRKYPCNYCSYVNKTAQGRTLHIRAHHPDEYELIRRKKFSEKAKED